MRRTSCELRSTERRRGHEPERGELPQELPVRGGAQPGLRAHGTKVGKRRGDSMRHKATLLVGGATAAALALGGLVGGVLAESRSSSASKAAPVALQDQAPIGAAGGVGAPALAALEKQVRAQPRDARYSHSSASRTSCAGARPQIPPIFLGPKRRFTAQSGTGSRTPRPFSDSAPSRSSDTTFGQEFATGGRRRSSCRGRRVRSASSATACSSSGATTPRLRRSSAW